MLRVAAPIWRSAGLQLGILSTGSARGVYAEELERAGYEVAHIPFRRTVDFLREVACEIRLGRFSVVHIHTERGSALYCTAARVGGARVIVRTIHNVFSFGGALRIRKLVERHYMRIAGTAFVSVSRSVAENERRRFGLPSRIIGNWIDEATFLPPSVDDRRRARIAFGASDGDLVVTSVGNCSVVKNHALILEAIALLRARMHVRYIHVGVEDEVGSERQLARSLGVEDCVVFAGYLPDVLPALHAADAFVMPSEYEGLGMSAVEALATGTHCILADRPGLRDLKFVAQGITWLKEVTAVEIADGILRRAGMSHGERAEEGLAASRIVRKRFAVREGAASYTSVYVDSRPT